MKRCSKCGLEKQASEFSKDSRNKDGLQRRCKSCMSEYYEKHRSKIRDQHRKYYHTHKDEILPRTKEYANKINRFVETLKTPCVKCGETRPWVIQFHHVDPRTKTFILSEVGTRSEARVLEEAKKCVCLCSNCHDEFHWFYGKVPDNPIEALNDYLKGNTYE